MQLFLAAQNVMQLKFSLALTKTSCVTVLNHTQCQRKQRRILLNIWNVLFNFVTTFKKNLKIARNHFSHCCKPWITLIIISTGYFEFKLNHKNSNDEWGCPVLFMACICASHQKINMQNSCNTKSISNVLCSARYYLWTVICRISYKLNPAEFNRLLRQVVLCNRL